MPDEAKATGEAAEGEAATTEEATGEEAATKETPPDTEPASDEPSVPLPPEVAERQMALMLLDQAGWGERGREGERKKERGT